MQERQIIKILIQGTKKNADQIWNGHQGKESMRNAK